MIRFPTMRGRVATSIPRFRMLPSPASLITFTETCSKAPIDLRIEAMAQDGLALGKSVTSSWTCTKTRLGVQTMSRSEISWCAIFHLGAYDEDYSFIRHQDTLENMVAVVGGQENLENSIEFVLWAAMLEFFFADQTPEIRNVSIRVANEFLNQNISFVMWEEANANTSRMGKITSLGQSSHSSGFLLARWESSCV